MSPREVVDVLIGCLYHKAFTRTTNHDGYRKGRIAMTERQMKLDLIGKLCSIFETAEWNDPQLEPLITYRFLFVTRLYLVDSDSDFRSAILRLLRHSLLSDRVVQLCCDLFIPELVTPCLERLKRTTPNEWVGSISAEQWNLEERVLALKVIRRWCSSYVAQQTVIPIPICFLRSLVAVAKSKPPLGIGINNRQPHIRAIDPLQFFCMGTLRDLAVGSDVSTFRRLSDVGGISAMVEIVGDVDVFETEPGFCRSLVVALSAIFGDDLRRMGLGDPEIITLKRSAQHLLPLCIFNPDGEPAVPWKPAQSRWFVELSYLSSKMMDTLIVSPDMGVGGGIKNIFHQKLDDSLSRKRAQEQEREQELLRWRRWRASSSAILLICRTFAGLIAVAYHPSGINALVELLRQPIDVGSRLRLVEFFIKLISMGITCAGVPIKNREDMLALIFCRALRGYWQNKNEMLISDDEELEYQTFRRPGRSSRQQPLGGSCASSCAPETSGDSCRGSYRYSLNESLPCLRKNLTEGLHLSPSQQSMQRFSVARASGGHYFWTHKQSVDAGSGIFSSAPSSEFGGAHQSPEIDPHVDERAFTLRPPQFSKPFISTRSDISLFDSGSVRRRWSTGLIGTGRPSDSLSAPLNQDMDVEFVKNEMIIRKLGAVLLRVPPAFFESFPIDSTFLLRTGLSGDQCQHTNDSSKPLGLGSNSPSPMWSNRGKMRTISSTDHSVAPTGSWDGTCTPSASNRNVGVDLPFLHRLSSSSTMLNGTSSPLRNYRPTVPGTGQRRSRQRIALSAAPTVSSLWSLSCPQYFGRIPNELVVASGLGYSSSDLRDIYGIILLRLLLNSGLHCALAGIIVTFRGKLSQIEEWRRVKLTRSDVEQELLASSERLLALIVCAASFLLPPHSADAVFSEIEIRVNEKDKKIGTDSPFFSRQASRMSNEIETNALIDTMGGEPTEARCSSSCTRSRFSSGVSTEMEDKSVSGISSLAEDPAIRGLECLLHRMSIMTSVPQSSSLSPSEVPNPPINIEPVSVVQNATQAGGNNQNLISGSLGFSKATLLLPSSSYRGSNRTSIAISTRLKECHTPTKKSTGLRFPKYVLAALECETNNSSNLFTQTRAKRLIYQFSKFLSTTYFVAKQLPGPGEYRSFWKKRLGYYVSRSCLVGSEDDPESSCPPILRPSSIGSAGARKRSSFFSAKSSGCRKDSTTHCVGISTATELPFVTESGDVTPTSIITTVSPNMNCCVCCGVEQMLNILNYVKYGSGTILHTELLYSLRVLRLTQKCVPFNSPTGLDAISTFGIYLNATGVLHQDIKTKLSEDSVNSTTELFVSFPTMNSLSSSTLPTTSSPFRNAYRTESEMTSSSVDTRTITNRESPSPHNTSRQHAAFTTWNWKLIYRLLTGPVKQYMLLFAQSPSAEPFISTLINFYLPSSRLFSTVSWSPSMLYLAVCGVHLISFLLVLEEQRASSDYLGDCSVLSSEYIQCAANSQHPTLPPSGSIIEQNCIQSDNESSSTVKHDDPQSRIYLLKTTFLVDLVKCLSIELDIAIYYQSMDDQKYSIGERKQRLFSFGSSNSSHCWIHHSEVHSNVFAAENLTHPPEAFEALSREKFQYRRFEHRRSRCSSSISLTNDRGHFSQTHGYRTSNRPRCLSEQSTFPKSSYLANCSENFTSYCGTKSRPLSQNCNQSFSQPTFRSLIRSSCNRSRGFSETKDQPNQSLTFSLTDVSSRHPLIRDFSTSSTNGLVNEATPKLRTHSSDSCLYETTNSGPSILYNPNTRSCYRTNGERVSLHNRLCRCCHHSEKCPHMLNSQLTKVKKHIGGRSLQELQSQRIFTRDALQLTLTREYATLVGAFSSTSSGVKALLYSGFFEVLYQLVALPSRDDLSLPFLKQLNMNFLPCRTIIDQVALRGSSWLKLAVLRHFGLMLDGGGISTSLSCLPLIEVIYQPPVWERNSESKMPILETNSYQTAASRISGGHQTSDYPVKEPLSPGERTALPNSYIVKDNSSLICQQALRDWLVNWLMNLILRIEFSSRTSVDTISYTATHDDEYTHRDCLSEQQSRYSDSSSDDGKPRSSPKTANGLYFNCCEENRCQSGNCGIGPRVSSMISELALNLVTELCKLGGSAIAASLLKYLPDSRGRIIIPPINVHTETARLHLSLVHQSKIPFNVCHAGQHYSILKDWPASLKIQLLQLDAGAEYLIHTGWVQEQLRLYNTYAHGMELYESNCYPQPSSTMDTESSVNLASFQHMEPDLTDRHSTTPFEFLGESPPDTGDRIHPNNSVNSQHSPPPLYSALVHEKQHSFNQRESGCSNAYVYITIVDTLLKNAFWNYTSIQQSLAIYGGPKYRRHTKPQRRHLVIPDPYFHHFYIAHDFHLDRFSPYIPSINEFHKTHTDCYDSLRKQSSASWKGFSSGSVSHLASNRIDQENKAIKDEDIHDAVWNVRKRVQYRHESSPFEFLSMIPFMFLIQVGQIQKRQLAKKVENSSHNKTEMPLEDVEEEEIVIRILDEVVVDCTVIRKIDPVLHERLCRAAKLESAAVRDFADKHTEECSTSGPHPPLFVSPSIPSAPFAIPCTPQDKFSKKTGSRKKRSSNPIATFEAVGLVDLTAHATSLSLLGLTSINFSLKQLRDIAPDEDIILRTTLKVGASYASPNGTLTNDINNAIWSNLSLRENRFVKNQMEQIEKQRCSSALLTSSSVSSTEQCQHNECSANSLYFAKSGINVMPFILEAQGYRWTFCLHVHQFAKDEPPSNSWIIDDTSGDNSGTQFLFESEEEKKLSKAVSSPLSGAIGTVELVRVETNVELTKEYSLTNILNKKNELDENGQIATLDIFPPHCTTPAKPPPNLLTYISLSETGVKLIEASGFLGKAHDVLNTKNSLKIRSYLWSIGHIASSEMGTMFLIRNQLLQRVVTIAYSSSRAALKGSALYVLSLIPVTSTTQRLMDALKWDLRARGPLQCELTRFVDMEGFHQRLPSRSSGDRDSTDTQQLPAAISHCSNSLRNNNSTNNSTVGLILGDKLKRDEQQELRLVGGIPEQMVGGYDLVNLVFGPPLQPSTIISFGLDVLRWKHYLHSKNDNINVANLTNNMLQQPSADHKDDQISLNKKFKAFTSFLLDEPTNANCSRATGNRKQRLLVEKVLPVNYIGFSIISVRYTAENREAVPNHQMAPTVASRFPSIVPSTVAISDKVMGSTLDTQPGQPTGVCIDRGPLSPIFEMSASVERGSGLQSRPIGNFNSDTSNSAIANDQELREWSPASASRLKLADSCNRENNQMTSVNPEETMLNAMTENSERKNEPIVEKNSALVEDAQGSFEKIKKAKSFPSDKSCHINMEIPDNFESNILQSESKVLQDQPHLLTTLSDLSITFSSTRPRIMSSSVSSSTPATCTRLRGLSDTSLLPGLACLIRMNGADSQQPQGVVQKKQVRFEGLFNSTMKQELNNKFSTNNPIESLASVAGFLPRSFDNANGEKTDVISFNQPLLSESTFAALTNDSMFQPSLRTEEASCKLQDNNTHYTSAKLLEPTDGEGFRSLGEYKERTKKISKNGDVSAIQQCSLESHRSIDVVPDGHDGLPRRSSNGIERFHLKPKYGQVFSDSDLSEGFDIQTENFSFETNITKVGQNTPNDKINENGNYWVSNCAHTQRQNSKEQKSKETPHGFVESEKELEVELLRDPLFKEETQMSQSTTKASPHQTMVSTHGNPYSELNLVVEKESGPIVEHIGLGGIEMDFCNASSGDGGQKKFKTHIKIDPQPSLDIYSYHGLTSNSASLNMGEEVSSHTFGMVSERVLEDDLQKKSLSRALSGLSESDLSEGFDVESRAGCRQNSYNVRHLDFRKCGQTDHLLKQRRTSDRRNHSGQSSRFSASELSEGFDIESPDTDVEKGGTREINLHKCKTGRNTGLVAFTPLPSNAAGDRHMSGLSDSDLFEGFDVEVESTADENTTEEKFPQRLGGGNEDNESIDPFEGFPFTSNEKPSGIKKSRYQGSGSLEISDSDISEGFNVMSTKDARVGKTSTKGTTRTHQGGTERYKCRRRSRYGRAYESLQVSSSSPSSSDGLDTPESPIIGFGLDDNQISRHDLKRTSDKKKVTPLPSMACDEWRKFLVQLKSSLPIELSKDDALPPFMQFNSTHETVLAEIASLPNIVVLRTGNLMLNLRKKRNATPQLFKSIELWWRVQMLQRVYDFPPPLRCFIDELFNETFALSAESWLYLDTIAQYLKWQCSI